MLISLVANINAYYCYYGIFKGQRPPYQRGLLPNLVASVKLVAST
mgnify:CR=1 FL=1